MPSSELSDRETMESGRSFPELTMSDLASSEGSPGSQVAPAFRPSFVLHGGVEQILVPLQKPPSVSRKTACDCPRILVGSQSSGITDAIRGIIKQQKAQRVPSSLQSCRPFCSEMLQKDLVSPEGKPSSSK